jgi:microsomal dipeptidase-like Zn-dependent dipeptidase
MAKERRQNSAADAITGLLGVIGLTIAKEFKDDPDGAAAARKMVADVTDSNLITAAEHLDDSIETKHQVDAILEQAGIDPVQLGRDNALAGAAAVVEVQQALAEPEAIEQDDTEQDDTEHIEQD